MSEKNSKCGCEGGTGFCKCPGSTGSVLGRAMDANIDGGMEHPREFWRLRLKERHSQYLQDVMFQQYVSRLIFLMRRRQLVWSDWRWWKYTNTKSGRGGRFRLDAYRLLGYGSCFTSLKWYWWMGKYGHAWLSKEREVAMEELKKANAPAGEKGNAPDQAIEMKRWQERWARLPGPTLAGDGGTYYAGVDNQGRPLRVRATRIVQWRTWPQFRSDLIRDASLIGPWSAVPRDPCCELEKLVHEQGAGVFLAASIGDGELHDAAFMVVAVNCIVTPRCAIVLMDWQEASAPALIDFERGTVEIGDEDIPQPGGFRGGSFVALGMNLIVKSISVHV